MTEQISDKPGRVSPNMSKSSAPAPASYKEL